MKRKLGRCDPGHYWPQIYEKAQFLCFLNHYTGFGEIFDELPLSIFFACYSHCLKMPGAKNKELEIRFQFKEFLFTFNKYQGDIFIYQYVR